MRERGGSTHVDVHDDRELFRAGEGGYHTYRIPALTVTRSGRLLAFCEGRLEGSGDAGRIDLLVRWSDDNGVTWAAPSVVAQDPPHTVGNPSPVVDRVTGRIHLVFCKNLGDGDEGLICAGKAPRTVWRTYSDDDGRTWSTPQEITSDVKRADWTWYATGPCHGVQLQSGGQSGRLVIPCDHIRSVNFDRKTDPYHSHLIFSDDGGERWQIGAVMPPDTNESTVAELSDGRLYLNCRNQGGVVRPEEARRVVGWSADGGLSVASPRKDPVLVDPICQGSAINHGGRLLFLNPAGGGRRGLTLRVSNDGGETWPHTALIWPGPAAYSDLCVLEDGRVALLYECGAQRPYESLRWSTLTLRLPTGMQNPPTRH